jgi:hypothetical protein
MTEKQKQFVDGMIKACDNHEQWLSIVRFGLPTLLQDQPGLIELMQREAQKLSDQDKGESTPAPYLSIILDQLQLKLETR